MGLCSTLLVLLATGCPAQVNDVKPVKKAPVPQVDESDPRVVKDGEDLYAENALKGSQVQEEPPNKGSGKTDESNGFCRLYAPKLPEPHCCQGEFGFDAQTVSKACGKSMYLGESFQNTCGYYFMDPEQGSPVWFRSSFVELPTAKEAAEAFANRVAMRFGAQDVSAKPMPGIEGVYTVAYEGLAYAWFKGDPSWPLVRRLAWKDETCDAEGIHEIVSQMVRAKSPKKGERRLGLVPKARE